LDNLARDIITALWPEGSAWNPQTDGDLDLLLDGMAENDQLLIDFVGKLCCVRDPFLTPILSDLEKEYGIITDTRLTEDQRRIQLAGIIFQTENNDSKDDLQNALNDAGFNVQVHENSPAVDPDDFLNSVPFMVAGGANAYAGYFPTTPGEYTSIAGKTGGRLLVNGRLVEQSPLILSAAGNEETVAGNDNALAGRYTELQQKDVIYPIPDDPNSWPFFFFVGGDAVRNIDGELVSIATVDVAVEQRGTFESIILKYKPIHTWAGLLINYK